MIRTLSKESITTSDTFPEVNFLIDSLDEEEMPDMTPFRKMEMEGRLLQEPLLKEDKSRFVLFPIQYPDVSRHVITLASSNACVNLPRI